MDTQQIRAYLQQMAAGTLDSEKEAWLLNYLENAGPEVLAEIYPHKEWEQMTPVYVEPAEMAAVYRKITGHVYSRIQWWRQGWAKAACIAALLMPAIFILSQKTQRTAAPPAQKWMLLSTRDGERKIVTLPDSTRLYMNGASEMLIPEVFEKDKRQVKFMKGEVFIDVSRDSKRPFAVLMDPLHVYVLGTSFNLRNYPEEPVVAVTVKTGKVAVGATGKADRLLLTAGKEGEYSKSNKVLQLAGSDDSRKVAGWINQEFYFDNVPLRQVLTALQHSYGLTFNTTDTTLLNRPVKASFRQQGPEEIMDILALMGKFSYQRTGSNIKIYSYRK